MTSSVRLGLLTDCHISAPGTADGRFNNPVRLGRSRELLATALDWLGDKVDALVFLGDLAQAALPEDYDYLFAHVAATRLPPSSFPGTMTSPRPTRGLARYCALCRTR